MGLYRNQLPQLAGTPLLTDGGIETTLIYHEGLELPDFAAFHLLRTKAGREALRRYFRTYASLAHAYEVGLVLESATWRASGDWGERLGYTVAELADANRAAIALLEEIRAEFADVSPVVISGCIGPRGDGYEPTALMTPAEAERYHATQVATFQETAADMITAITMTNVDEAIGIARAAARAGMPIAISFTVETDGRLPTGDTLRDAIERVDAATHGTPAYYMVNCAHPTHFAGVLADEPWVSRIRGIRANASTKSHAELNESAELDVGDPVAFARDHLPLFDTLKNLSVLGGCCGTDHRHLEEICIARFAERRELRTW